MELTKLAQLRHWEVVTREVQEGIEQHGAMAIGHNESVSIWPGGVGGVVSEVISPECHGHVGHAHRHAGVARIGLLNGIHGQGSDCIGHLGGRGIHGLTFS